MQRIKIAADATQIVNRRFFLLLNSSACCFSAKFHASFAVMAASDWTLDSFRRTSANNLSVNECHGHEIHFSLNVPYLYKWKAFHLSRYISRAKKIHSLNFFLTVSLSSPHIFQTPTQVLPLFIFRCKEELSHHNKRVVRPSVPEN